MWITQLSMASECKLRCMLYPPYFTNKNCAVFSEYMRLLKAKREDLENGSENEGGRDFASVTSSHLLNV